MKKTLLFFAAAICCGMSLRAQDTLSVKNPTEVQVIKDKNSMSVTITGSENDADFRYSSSLEAGPSAVVRTTERVSRGRFDLSVPLLGAEEDEGKSTRRLGEVDLVVQTGFGICFPSGLDNPAYSPMREAWGLDFTLNLLHAEFSPWRGKSHFFANFGLEDKSFKIRGDERYVKGQDNVLGFAPFAPNTPKWSALRIFSWNIGVGYTQHIYDRVSLTVGPIVNFNTGSRIKTKWYDDQNAKHKDKVKFGKQNLVTYELMGRLSFGNIGIYVKYNPCSLIDKNFGPEFTTWSVGIIL